MKRLGIVKITPELLGNVLGIKPDIGITNLFQTDQDKISGIFSMTVTGPDLYSTPEGSPIMVIPISDIQDQMEEYYD